MLTEHLSMQTDPKPWRVGLVGYGEVGRILVEDLRAQAVRDGMTTLMQDGIRKILLGFTDIQQVRKVCIK